MVIVDIAPSTTTRILVLLSLILVEKMVLSSCISLGSSLDCVVIAVVGHGRARDRASHQIVNGRVGRILPTRVSGSQCPAIEMIFGRSSSTFETVVL